MQSIAERLARAESEIAMAIEESCHPHTEAQHLGILLWELDWRVEREAILAEMGAVRFALAEGNADGFGVS